MAEVPEQAFDPELYRLELRSDYRVLWLISLANVAYYGSIYAFKTSTTWLSAAEQTFYESALGASAGIWALFYIMAWRGWSGIRSAWWWWWLTFLTNVNLLSVYDIEM